VESIRRGSRYRGCFCRLRRLWYLAPRPAPEGLLASTSKTVKFNVFIVILASLAGCYPRNSAGARCSEISVALTGETAFRHVASRWLFPAHSRRVPPVASGIPLRCRSTAPRYSLRKRSVASYQPTLFVVGESLFLSGRRVPTTVLERSATAGWCLLAGFRNRH